MNYVEFLGCTKMSEEYISESEFDIYILPHYLESEQGITEFCDKFKKLHTDYVVKIIAMADCSCNLNYGIMETFISGPLYKWDNVNNLAMELRYHFLRAWACLEYVEEKRDSKNGQYFFE